MKQAIIIAFFFLLHACEAFNNGRGIPLEEKVKTDNIKRSDFPPGFLFGASTSAYQNDIEMMHSLGLKAYRFSISWARILPRGRSGEVNSLGITFYNKIIDNLIVKGIEPFVTLHHFDFPQELEERYGSWLNIEMQEEFVHMAKICFTSFGDRVKYWITLNEPNTIARAGYEMATTPPNRCSEPFGNCSTGNSDVEPLIVTHNMLLAHGKAARLYHQNFQPKQGGLIGLVVICNMLKPLTNSELDLEATKRALAYSVGWALDPSIFGDYPEEMHDYLGNELPSFSTDEKEFMKNSVDFIGVNHYTSYYIKDCTNSSCSPTSSRAIRGFLEQRGDRDGIPIGERTGQQACFVVPNGIEEIVNILKVRYNNKLMFITENGYPSLEEGEEQVDVLLKDVKRVEFHTTYLSYLSKAIRAGANVRGYFVWSLMDCFDFLSGYKLNYGLYHVNRQTLTRMPKLSAIWYKNFLTNNDDLDDKRASRDI